MSKKTRKGKEEGGVSKKGDRATLRAKNADEKGKRPGGGRMRAAPPMGQKRATGKEGARGEVVRKIPQPK